MFVWEKRIIIFVEKKKKNDEENNLGMLDGGMFTFDICTESI